MNIVSTTHLVLIPSYNTGPLLYTTVREARKYWAPVWVVVDGSTDGSAEELQRMSQQDPALQVIVLPHNQGKGAAVLQGLREATRQGFTHVLTMDSDGQHPPEKIPEFMAASLADANARTGDLGGKGNTQSFADTVVRHLRNPKLQAVAAG